MLGTPGILSLFTNSLNYFNKKIEHSCEILYFLHNRLVMKYVFQLYDHVNYDTMTKDTFTQTAFFCYCTDSSGVCFKS